MISKAQKYKERSENSMEEKEIRLNKYLSESGVCSRREADRLIAEGTVKIDGETAQVGAKVSPGQSVVVKGKEVVPAQKKILLAFYKPKGIVCTAEKREKNNIIDYINYPERIYYVGRLDKESEGLILLTNYGDIVNKMMRSANGHEKEYVVKVNKKLTDEFLTGMAGRVPLEEINAVTKPSKVTKVDDYTFKIVLTQGLNRQIRRMCMYFGYRVVALKRIRVMNIKLGNLKRGEYRDVTEAELAELLRLLSHSDNRPMALRKGKNDGSSRKNQRTDRKTK